MKMTEENYDREHDGIKEDVATKDIDLEKKSPENDVFYEDLTVLSEMPLKEKIPYKWNRLKQRLDTMDKDEKVKYVLNYYKYHILIAVVSLVLLVIGGYRLYDSLLPVDLMVIIVNDLNIDKDVPAPDYIDQTYRDYYTIPQSHKTEVVEGMFLNDGVDLSQQENYISSIQYWSYIKDNELDAAVADAPAMRYMTMDESILPVDECLSEELYDQIKEHIVMHQDSEGNIRNGQSFPAAIDISGTQFAKDLNLSYSDVYIVIPSNRTEDSERTEKLVKLIFDIK